MPIDSRRTRRASRLNYEYRIMIFDFSFDIRYSKFDILRVDLVSFNLVNAGARQTTRRLHPR
jgi:hypothetical protein